MSNVAKQLQECATREIFFLALLQLGLLFRNTIKSPKKEGVFNQIALYPSSELVNSRRATKKIDFYELNFYEFL